MNQNPHWKQLIWNWASIIFGNALYSLAVALFLEPAGLITDAEARKDGAEEDVLRQHPAIRHPLEQGEEGGAENTAGQRIEGEGPAQDHPAPDQHGEVDEEQQP